MLIVGVTLPFLPPNPGHRTEQRGCADPLLQSHSGGDGLRRAGDGVLRPAERGNSGLDPAGDLPGERKKSLAPVNGDANWAAMNISPLRGETFHNQF